MLYFIRASNGASAYLAPAHALAMATLLARAGIRYHIEPVGATDNRRINK